MSEETSSAEVTGLQAEPPNLIEVIFCTHALLLLKSRIYLELYVLVDFTVGAVVGSLTSVSVLSDFFSGVFTLTVAFL